MYGGVLCLLMLKVVQKLKKACVFCLIHMFEFTCFRSSHEKLLYQVLFDIEIDALRNSEKGSVLVKLMHTYSSTKHKIPLKYFIRGII